MDRFDYDDFYDPRTPCPNCGKPMQSDVDGDGVMTMSYEFCEGCGEKDYGEPVRLFEEHILPRLRAEEGR